MTSSSCCNADVKVSGGDREETTRFYVCEKCDRACDVNHIVEADKMVGEIKPDNELAELLYTVLKSINKQDHKKEDSSIVAVKVKNHVINIRLQARREAMGETMLTVIEVLKEYESDDVDAVGEALLSRLEELSKDNQ